MNMNAVWSQQRYNDGSANEFLIIDKFTKTFSQGLSDGLNFDRVLCCDLKKL